MGVKLVLDDATNLAPGIWRATVRPEDTAIFGVAGSRSGEITILLLPNVAPPSDEAAGLTFEPSYARLLNAGSTSQAIVVFGAAGVEDDDQEVVRQRFGPRVQHDDERYLDELKSLPDTLAQAGADILTAMRDSNGGYFQKTSSGRFVNRPNNFWTVKVQPRDRSLRFTVRGSLSRFGRDPGIEMRPDRNGYSTFKLSEAGQRDRAIAILGLAGSPK